MPDRLVYSTGRWKGAFMAACLATDSDGFSSVDAYWGSVQDIDCKPLAAWLRLVYYIAGSHS